MLKATEELANTHRVVEKVLKQFAPDQPRFNDVMKTLRRTALAHAWLQDQIFLRGLKGKPLIVQEFLDQITQEHQTLDHLIELLQKTPQDQKKELDAQVLQIRTLIKTHFEKEAKALYPLSEEVIDIDTLNALRDEMQRRETEIRSVVKS